MHPTTPLRKVLWRALLVALSLCVLPPALGRAQDAKPPQVTGTLIVPIGGTQRLQMTKKQVIAKAINRNEAVLRVSPVYGDPTTVLLNGLEPGVAIVTLIDEAAKEENFQIIVQLDVEYLKSLLKRAVPTANIDPIPGANNTIVLRGTVARAEDVEVVAAHRAERRPGPRPHHQRPARRRRAAGAAVRGRRRGVPVAEIRNSASTSSSRATTILVAAPSAWRSGLARPAALLTASQRRDRHGRPAAPTPSSAS